MIYENLGDLAAAEEQLLHAVTLDEAIDHSDLVSNRAVLAHIQARQRAAQE